MKGTSQHGSQQDTAMANYLYQLKKPHKRTDYLDGDRAIILDNQFREYPPIDFPSIFYK